MVLKHQIFYESCLPISSVEKFPAFFAEGRLLLELVRNVAQPFRSAISAGLIDRNVTPAGVESSAPNPEFLLQPAFECSCRAWE